MTKMKSASAKIASGARTAVLAAKTGGASAAAAAIKSTTTAGASNRVQSAMRKK